MSALRNFFNKTISFLSAQPLVGGLEVSDQVLRLAYYEHKAWQMAAVRLAPGVLEKGKIKDAAAFAAALHELKLKVPFKKKKKMNVVISLSSVNMYGQVFSLPKMEGKDFENAVDLNVRMLSPVDIAQTYFGWEILGDDSGGVKMEIATAFVDKALVDAMTQALYTAGFITVGVESRALALVRVFRERGVNVDAQKPYLLIDIDNSGIDFLIVRKGKLYFEYVTQWEDLADDKGQIYITKFQEALVANVRQVMNFYPQHWPEPLAGVVLAASAFEKEAEEAVRSSISLPVLPIALKVDQQISSEWVVALGCSLKGDGGGSGNSEINLSGEAAIDTFHEEQLLDFMALWRVIIPVVLGCLVIVFVGADDFLATTKAGINVPPAIGEQEVAAMNALEASSTAFNESVALVANAEAQLSRNYLLVPDIENMAAANGVTIDQLSFQGAGIPASLNGTTQSEAQIAAFKSAVTADPHLSAVDLPLSNIQGENGVYTFSMTFSLSPGF